MDPNDFTEREKHLLSYFRTAAPSAERRALMYDITIGLVSIACVVMFLVTGEKGYGFAGYVEVTSSWVLIPRPPKFGSSCLVPVGSHCWVPVSIAIGFTSTTALAGIANSDQLSILNWQMPALTLPSSAFPNLRITTSSSSMRT